MTQRERVLQALVDALATGFIGLGVPPEVRRGGELPTRIPPGGLIVLRDGEAGEPEITLSPPLYEYRHRAEIEVFLQPQTGVDPAAAMDGLIEDIGVVLAVDRTLGGLCLWVEPEAPVLSELALEGAAGIVAAIVPIELTYITTGPLA